MCRDARRVVAVGTTAVRALESAALTGEAEGRTRLFIHRPYDWRAVDVLMTAFGVNALYLPLVEERGLARRFGEEWAAYRASVPRYVPRRTPWDPPG